MKYHQRTKMIRIASGVLWVLAPLLRASAQNGSDSVAANAAYEAKEWRQSAALYQGITSREPKNGRAWYRYGVSLYREGEPEKAVAALQAAIDNGAPAFLGEYQMAIAYALLSKGEETLAHLDRAVNAGFAQPDSLRSDPEFASYRADPRFAKLIAAAERNEKPCDYAPESRQFDFWLGEWNVVTTTEKTTGGKSRIERILNGCVILENWTSANPPYQGKSFNTYNSVLKRWEQFWVDNSAGMIHFYGGLKDGLMDFWTDAIPQPDGKLLKRHLQFIPLGPDTVRQFSRGSNDDGKTWFVEYDLTYNRVGQGQ